VPRMPERESAAGRGVPIFGAFYFSRPKSQEPRGETTKPTRKLVRAVLDALTGIAYETIRRSPRSWPANSTATRRREITLTERSATRKRMSVSHERQSKLPF